MSIKDGSLGCSVYDNEKYTVDCFVGPQEEYKFPEASYDVKNLDELTDLLKSVSRKVSGIRLVQVWINEPTE